MTKDLINTLNFRSLVKVIITSLFVGVLFNSCKKNNTTVDLVIPSHVSFSNTALTIEKDFNGAVPITISLAHPLEKAGTITISIDNTTTAATTEYTTVPAANSGIITLSLDKGATTASFTLTSAHNFDDGRTIIFKITSTSGGFALGVNLSLTVTLHGNKWVTPSIVTSVTTLDNFGSVNKGALSAVKSYLLSANNVGDPVSIVASDNFKVSFNNSTFSSSLSTNVGATPVIVYVKFTPATGTNQAITGTITNSSTTAPSVIIAVGGTEAGNIPYVPEVPLLNENFDYGATSNFLTRLSPSWVAYSDPGSIPVTYITQGLSFAGYGDSGVGGSVTLEHGDFSREDIAHPYTPQTSGTVYTALMVNVSAAGSGDFFYALRDASGGFFSRLYAKDDGAGNLVLGVGKNSTAQYPTVTFKYNTTYLVVMKYDFTAKTASLYVLNGTIPATEPGTPTMVSATGTAPTSLIDVAIRQAGGVLSANIDGIRIATTWRGVLGI